MLFLLVALGECRPGEGSPLAWCSNDEIPDLTFTISEDADPDHDKACELCEQIVYCIGITHVEGMWKMGAVIDSKDYNGTRYAPGSSVFLKKRNPPAWCSNDEKKDLTFNGLDYGSLDHDIACELCMANENCIGLSHVEGIWMQGKRQTHTGRNGTYYFPNSSVFLKPTNAVMI